jgi:GcrA cell cycle regulator
MNAWPDDRVDNLKKLYEAGLSHSQIAAELNRPPFEKLPHLTRNATIGKIHRMGLDGRDRPKCSAAPRQQRARRSQYAPIPGRNFKSTVTRAATALAEAFEVEMAPDVLAYDNVIPIVQRVTLMQLTEATCKWPIGDPQHKDFYFCGGKALPSLPYCAHHCRVAFQAPEDRRRKPREP